MTYWVVQIHTVEGFITYPVEYPSEIQAQDVANAFRVQARIIGANNQIRVLRIPSLTANN